MSKIKLTATDYYKANDPKYMKDNPDIRKALIRIQKNCKPLTCETCYFFRWNVIGKKLDPECSIGDVKYFYGRRADGCPLDTGKFKEGSDERETGSEAGGSEN